jgi:carbonic anhydrase
MISVARTASYTASLVLMLCPLLRAAQDSNPVEWSYAGVAGPSHWASIDPKYSACSLGHSQSPINIERAKPAHLPPLTMDYHEGPLTITNNGHSIQVTYPPGSTLSVGDKTFRLMQFHFHHPSEEHLNGKGFPLVAHLVHQDSEGHLAVVAVLFEEGKANPLIDALWSNAPEKKGEAHDVASVSVQALDLLPAERGYYTFTGSLTTPPCSEGVTWYVLRVHPTVSAQQIARFSQFYPMNARPIQARNGRTILRSD